MTIRPIVYYSTRTGTDRINSGHALMNQKLTVGQITIGALASINCLLALYIIGLSYLAYVDDQLAFKLINLVSRVMGV